MLLKMHFPRFFIGQILLLVGAVEILFVAGNIDASGDIITYDTVGKGVKKVVLF